MGLIRQKPSSLFMLLGWNSISIASLIVFGFGVEDAEVLELHVMFQVDVPCHD
jgi:hypothetical protein